MGRDHQGLQFLPDLLREVAHDLISDRVRDLLEDLPDPLLLPPRDSGPLLNPLRVHTQVHTQEHTQELPCRFQWRGVDGDGQPHTNAAQSWKPPAHWQ